MSAVASARDRDSFMRIYDHFMPRLCVYLRGLGTPPAVAEELAQESLLRLWQNAASYDPRRSAVSTHERGRATPASCSKRNRSAQATRGRNSNWS